MKRFFLNMAPLKKQNDMIKGFCGLRTREFCSDVFEFSFKKAHMDKQSRLSLFVTKFSFSLETMRKSSVIFYQLETAILTKTASLDLATVGGHRLIHVYRKPTCKYDHFHIQHTSLYFNSAFIVGEYRVPSSITSAE